MLDNIFICYASEDYEEAENLFNILSEGYKPWLDKKSLLSGQDFDYFIMNEIKKSDFAIVLLSSNSILKRSYKRKEYAAILERKKMMLADDIYIIPVKLDECQIPDDFDGIEWLDRFDEDFEQKIFLSINSQIRKRLKEQQDEMFRNNGFSYEPQKWEFRYGENHPYLMASFEYPKFKGNNSIVEGLNAIIAYEIYLAKERCNKYKFREIEIIENDESTFYNECDNDIDKNSISIVFTSSTIISFLTYYTYYSIGAAHPYTACSGSCYLLTPFFELELNDIIDVYSSIKPLKNLVNKRLLQVLHDEYEVKNPKEVLLAPLKAKEEDFENFYITADGIVFIYVPYQITPYSFGNVFVDIAKENLLRDLNDDDIFKKMYKMIWE